jgi:rhodanese-related sulfurtransferase
VPGKDPRRLARLALALGVCATGPTACVIWPAGTGPGAEPMSLAEATLLRDRGEALIVDVRPAQEYAAGHIAGAVNVPLDEIGGRIVELRRTGKLPIFYCGCPHGEASVRAARILHAQGLDARVLGGTYPRFSDGRPGSGS